LYKFSYKESDKRDADRAELWI